MSEKPVSAPEKPAGTPRIYDGKGNLTPLPDEPATVAPAAEVSPDTVPALAEAPPEKKPTYLYKVPSVFKSRLAHITNIEASEGFIKVYTNDGKVHSKTAEEVRDVARDLATTLESMKRAELRGIQVPAHVRKQTLELISKLSAAHMAAKHQQETALRMDHVPRAMQRMTDNLAWQKGGLPGRGAYTADNLPEESNIRFLQSQMSTLTEGEIATILRSTRLPYDYRVQVLKAMHMHRLRAENKATGRDVMNMQGVGPHIELPVGAGLRAPKGMDRKIVVPVAGKP